jgi:hypothetical protein
MDQVLRAPRAARIVTDPGPCATAPATCIAAVLNRA